MDLLPGAEQASRTNIPGWTPEIEAGRQLAWRKFKGLAIVFFAYSFTNDSTSNIY